MKKLLIEIGLNALSKLLRRSIKNEALLQKLLLLLAMVGDVADVLTDDDVSNDEEVRKILQAGLMKSKDALFS